MSVFLPQGCTRRRRCQVDAGGAGYGAAARQAVVQEKTEPDQRPRSHGGNMRQHEPQRLHKVRRARHQHFALFQGVADEPELHVFEIAQAAVNQFRTGRRCAAGEVAGLDDQHGEAAARRVAGNSDAVDAAADDRQVVDFSRLGHPLPQPVSSRVSAIGR